MTEELSQRKIKKENIYAHMDFLNRIENLVDEWDVTRLMSNRGYAISTVMEFVKWALESGKLIEDSKHPVNDAEREETGGHQMYVDEELTIRYFFEDEFGGEHSIDFSLKKIENANLLEWMENTGNEIKRREFVRNS